MPTVLIDADGCPVVDLTIHLCKSQGNQIKKLGTSCETKCSELHL